MKEAEDLDGAEALLLLGAASEALQAQEKQEATQPQLEPQDQTQSQPQPGAQSQPSQPNEKTDSQAAAAAPPTPVDQATRAWLQLLGHIMGIGHDAALIGQLLSAAEAAAATVNTASDNPVLVQLRALHTLLQQHGATAAATAAAAMLAARGANHARCSTCGRSCLTVDKIELNEEFSCTSSRALYPREQCRTESAPEGNKSQPTSAAEPKRRRTGNGSTGGAQEAMRVPAGMLPAPTPPVSAADSSAKDDELRVPSFRFSTPLVPLVKNGPQGPQKRSPSSAVQAPVLKSTAGPASQPAGATQGKVRAASPKQPSPGAERAPKTGSSLVRQWMGRTRSQRIQQSSTSSAATSPVVTSPLGRSRSEPLELDKAGGLPSSSTKSALNGTAIGTTQPVVIRIKQDSGTASQATAASAAPASAPSLPILPLSTALPVSPAGAANACPSPRSIAANAPGEEQERQMAPALGIPASDAAMSAPASAPAPVAALRTVTSVPQRAWLPPPVGAVPSVPPLPLPTAAPYRAVITSGDTPKPGAAALAAAKRPPARSPRLTKVSSESALGYGGGRSASPAAPDSSVANAMALLQSAAEQAYRRSASDPTSQQSTEAAAAAALASAASESRPLQTVSTGAPGTSPPPRLTVTLPQPATSHNATVSTGHTPNLAGGKAAKPASGRKGRVNKASKLGPQSPTLSTDPGARSERPPPSPGRVGEPASAGEAAAAGDLDQATPAQLASPSAEPVRLATSSGLTLSWLPGQASQGGRATADSGGPEGEAVMRTVSDPGAARDLVRAGLVPRTVSDPASARALAMVSRLMESSTSWEAEVHGKDEAGHETELLRVTGVLPLREASALPTSMHVTEWKQRSEVPMSSAAAAPLFLQLADSVSAEQRARMNSLAHDRVALIVELPDFDFALVPHRSTEDSVLHIVGLKMEKGA